MAFAPKIAGTDRATLVVPDGRPKPAGSGLTANATPQPHQPMFVLASGQLGSEIVTWTMPGNQTYEGFRVHSADASGTIGPVVATVGPDARRAEVTGLADRTTYSYAVEAVLPGGAFGPMSVVVSDSTVGRLLTYSNRNSGDLQWGISSRGLDPLGNPARRAVETGAPDHLVLSPDRSTLAASVPVFVGQDGVDHVCRIDILSRTGTSAPASVPGASPVCSTYPSFLTSTTIVFSRQDDVANAASAPYLATYDVTTQAIAPVVGGAGLTQPAVAPDGSIVAVDPVAKVLVRLTALGTKTVIPNTAGADQPAVSPTGKLAFIATTEFYDQRLVLANADGSGAVTLTAQDKMAKDPSWSSDGSAVYFALEGSIWRTSGGAPVSVTNADGSSPGTPVVIEVPDTNGPAVKPSTLPAYTKATTVTVTASGSDPGPAGSGIATYDGRYRTGPAGGSLGEHTSPAGWTGSATPSFDLPVTSGQRYCVSVRATDKAGNAGAWSAESCTTADRALPTAVLSIPSGTTSVSSPLKATWVGADAGGSGVATYELRTNRAAPAGGFGPWTYPAGLQHTTATSGAVPGTAGYTACFAVRVTDKAGNVGAWSAQKCTVLPIDDRSFSVSGAWSRIGGAGFYLRTATASTKAGVKLVSPSLQTQRLALVATKCPTCGVVAVYIGPKLLAKVNLAASSTSYRNVIALPRFSLRTDRVSMVVVSSGKTVQVDGLSSSRL